MLSLPPPDDLSGVPIHYGSIHLALKPRITASRKRRLATVSAHSTGFTTDCFGTVSGLHDGLELVASPVCRLDVFIGVSFLGILERPARSYVL
jgi:hypothetical protein